jgi:hypothetical protein
MVVWLAGCGVVKAESGPDAMEPDPWQSSCTLPTPLITVVDSASGGYGNKCLHGSWNLQSLNGSTSPPSVGLDGNTAQVRPTAIIAGFNTLDLTSTFAIHVSGSGQQNVGQTFSYAQLGAPLNAASATQVGSVDASAYTGVQFQAIVRTAATGAHLSIGNLFTDPIGGMCTPADGDTECYDHPQAPLAPSTTWTQYRIAFNTLKQVGFGNQSPIGAAFPSSAITFIRWDIGIPATAPVEPWELWIDNLTFY